MQIRGENAKIEDGSSTQKFAFGPRIIHAKWQNSTTKCRCQPLNPPTKGPNTTIKEFTEHLAHVFVRSICTS